MIGGGQLLQHASLLMKLEGKSFWMVGWGEENSRRKRKKSKGEVCTRSWIVGSCFGKEGMKAVHG
jgi:hypothetical protein